MAYNFTEHAHRYACWTAARAASTSTSRFSNMEVMDAIKKAGIPKRIAELEQEVDLNSNLYRQNFIAMVEALISHLPHKRSAKREVVNPVNFGTAAKILSIYIKTTVVLPTQGQSKLAQLAYPPIDSILLKGITNDTGLRFPSTAWSTFSENQFFEVIDILESAKSNKAWWEWEAHWNPGE